MSLKLVEIENKQYFECSDEDQRALYRTLNLLDELYDLLDDMNYKLSNIDTTYDFIDNFYGWVNGVDDDIREYLNYYEKYQE